MKRQHDVRMIGCVSYRKQFGPLIKREPPDAVMEREISIAVQQRSAITYGEDDMNEQQNVAVSTQHVALSTRGRP